MSTFLKSSASRRRRSSFGGSSLFGGSAVPEQERLAEENRIARQTNPLVGVTDQLVRQRQATEQESAMERVEELIRAGETDSDEFRTMLQVAEKGYAEPEENFLQRTLNVIEGLGNVGVGGFATVARNTFGDLPGMEGLFGERSALGMTAKATTSEGGIRNLFNRDYAPLAEAAGRGGRELFGLDDDEEAGPGADQGRFAFGDIIRYDMERITGVEHEDQPGWVRALVSAGGFVGDEVLNPINYVTLGGGGVGRQVVTQAVRTTGKQVGARIAREISEEGAEAVLRRAAQDGFEDAIARPIAERVTEQSIRETAEQMAKEAGTEVTEATLKEARETLATRVADEVTAPWAQAAAQRNWKAIPEAVRKSGTVTKNMPWLAGGVRFTPNPLGAGLKGAGVLSRPLPGTTGLGRGISRTVLGTRPGSTGRGFLLRNVDDAAGSGLAGRMSKTLEGIEDARARFSNTYASILAAKRGQLGAFDDITDGLQRALRETGLTNRRHAFALTARSAAKELNKLSDEQMEAVGNLMHYARHGGIRLDVPEQRAAFMAELPEELSDEAKTAVVDFMDQTFDILSFTHRKARDMGIDIAERENYWPLIWTKEFTNDLRRLAGRGVGVPSVDEIPEGIREGVAWIIEAINGVNAKRAAGDGVAIVGETRFSNERILGIETEIREIGDVMLVGNRDAARLRYTSHPEMKEQIDKAAQWLADRQNIKLSSFGRSGRGSVETDPIRAMNVYFRSMESAIAERHLQRQGREAGWLVDQNWRVDTSRTVNGILQNMFGAANTRRAAKLTERIGNRLGVIEGELADPEIGMVAQKAGDFELAVPRRASMDPSPAMIRAKQKLEQRSAALKAANRRYEDAQRRVAQQLEAQGVPSETAQTLAGAQTLAELREYAQAAEILLRDDLRASTDALWQTLGRVRTDAADAAKKFDRAARAARRDAAASDRAIEKMRRDVHRKITKNLQAKRAITFDDAASRGRLAQLMGAHFANKIRLADPDGVLSEGVVDILERVARGEAVDGSELEAALRAGRSYFENAVPDQHAVDRARGLILDGFDDIRRVFPEADRLIGPRKTLEVMDNQGQEGLFQHWRNTFGLLKQALKDRPKEAGAALRIAEDIDTVMLTLASEAGSDWHLRQFLTSNALYDQVDMIRKVLDGRRAYLPTKTEEVLAEIGLIGDNLKFQTRRSGLGFQLVPSEQTFITPLDIVDEARGLAEPGIRSVADVFRARLTAAFGSDAAFARYMRGTMKGWNGVNNIGIDARDRYYETARRVLKREFAEATDVEQLGDFYRVRSKGGRVMWTELDAQGEPVAWAVLGDLPLLGRGSQIPADRFLDMLTAARRYGDNLDSVLDGTDWLDVHRRASGAMNRLSDDAAEALDALDAVDADATMISKLSDALDEGLDASRRRADIEGLEASRAARLGAAEALDEIREIIRPLKNRSASKADADAAMVRFDAAARRLAKILPPADLGQLDTIRFQIERVQALANVKNRKNPLLEKMLDAREDLRRKWTNPDRLIEGFNKAAAERQQVLQGEYLEDAVTTQNMIAEMNRTLQEILGFTADEDGVVRKVFLPDEQEARLVELVERGKGLWADIFGKDNPFETVKVPVPHADGFIPPEQARIGGAAWNGVVGQEAAMRWVSNVTAMMVSMSDDEVLEGFARWARSLLSGWKANATVARPTFHLRNVIGGLWNGAMAGARASDYAFSSKWSARFIEDLKRTSDVEEIFAKYPEDVAKTLRAAWGEGIVHQSFSASEIIAEGLTKVNKLQRLNLLGKDNVAVMAGGRTMEHIEFWMRLAVFHRHFDASAELPQAAASIARSWVDMVHFDYQNLTRIERQIKQFLPFFVWFRRNLPLQMQALVERPGYLASYQNLITNADVYDDTAFDDLPPNQYRMGTQYGTVGATNEESPFWTMWMFDPDLPIKQVLELGDPLSPAAWSTMLANQLGPQFDIAASLTGQGDENYWINAPGGISQVLNWVDSFGGHGVDEGILPGVDSTPMGVARLRPWSRTLFSTLFPSLNELGGFTLEQDPRRRGNIGQDPLFGPAGEEGEPDTITDELKAAIAMLGRGVGIQGTSPAEGYGTMVGQSFDRGDDEAERKKRGLLPEEEEQTTSIFG